MSGWEQLLSDHGLAVTLVVVFIVGTVLCIRTVWKYLTTDLIPNLHGGLLKKVDDASAANTKEHENISTKIDGMNDGLDILTTVVMMESDAPDVDDQDFKVKLSKVKALRRIANGVPVNER